MPHMKYDQEGMIVRNYPVKCPGCKALIFLTYEDDSCPYCQAWICPDCLTLLNKDNTHKSSGSGYNGSWLTITCKKCGYDVVDADLP